MQGNDNRAKEAPPLNVAERLGALHALANRVQHHPDATVFRDCEAYQASFLKLGSPDVARLLLSTMARNAHGIVLEFLENPVNKLLYKTLPDLTAALNTHVMTQAAADQYLKYTQLVGSLTPIQHAHLHAQAGASIASIESFYRKIGNVYRPLLILHDFVSAKDRMLTFELIKTFEDFTLAYKALPSKTLFTKVDAVKKMRDEVAAAPFELALDVLGALKSISGPRAQKVVDGKAMQEQVAKYDARLKLLPPRYQHPFEKDDYHRRVLFQAAHPLAKFSVYWALQALLHRLCAAPDETTLESFAEYEQNVKALSLDARKTYLSHMQEEHDLVIDWFMAYRSAREDQGNLLLELLALFRGHHMVWLPYRAPALALLTSVRAGALFEERGARCSAKLDLHGGLRVADPAWLALESLDSRPADKGSQTQWATLARPTGLLQHFPTAVIAFSSVHRQAETHLYDILVSKVNYYMGPFRPDFREGIQEWWDHCFQEFHFFGTFFPHHFTTGLEVYPGFGALQLLARAYTWRRWYPKGMRALTRQEEVKVRSML
jgi:hypothetical protein